MTTNNDIKYAAMFGVPIYVADGKRYKTTECFAENVLTGERMVFSSIRSLAEHIGVTEQKVRSAMKSGEVLNGRVVFRKDVF